MPWKIEGLFFTVVSVSYSWNPALICYMFLTVLIYDSCMSFIYMYVYVNIYTHSHIQKNISEGIPYLVFHVKEVTFKHTNITCKREAEKMMCSLKDSVLAIDNIFIVSWMEETMERGWGTDVHKESWSKRLPWSLFPYLFEALQTTWKWI